MNNLIILIIVAVLMYSLLNNNTEHFDEGDSHSTSLSQMYNVKPESIYQTGQVYNPFYNYPEYIGKYPYYRYFFSPYGYTSYY